MFEGLTQKLQSVFSSLSRKGTLREGDITEALREIRRALLEADVNFRVAKDLVNQVKERALSQEVLQSLSPGQQVVKIVSEELQVVLGQEASPLQFAAQPPTIIMLVGLQGSGKTTTAGKLALYVRKQGRRPMLVATDVYRPAAIEQLQIVGKSLDVPVHADFDSKDPLKIARDSVDAASGVADVLIIDTAGRLHVDVEMMDEATQLHQNLSPHETLLVLDAMTGQDAVNVATEFGAAVDITGYVLTKMDGDARGGAALSIRAVTGKPIKFIGTGEKSSGLELFHPDRMASRILGMGDMLSLIERAQDTINLEEAARMQKKMLSNRFDLEDFLSQLQQVRKMGPLSQLLEAIPGFNAQAQQPDVDEKELDRFQAIIQSMTRQERRDPSIMNGGRRRRVADGSGATVQQVNQLLKQFSEMRRMMQQFSGMRGGKRGRGARAMPFLR